MNLQSTIALRSLARNKTYVLINVLTMGIAIGCCIVAYLNYADWIDFDQIHAGKNNVYRVNSTRTVENETQLWGVTPLPLGPAAAAQVPGIERYSRLSYDVASVRHDGAVFGESVLYVDPDFLRILSFPSKSGSLRAIDDPGQIVLTEQAAIRFFGDKDPVGESLDFLFVAQGEVRSLTVGAVLYDIPVNSSIQFDILASYSVWMQLYEWTNEDWWHWQQPITLLELTDRVTPEIVEEGLQQFVAPQNEARPNWAVTSYFLQPLSDIAHGSYHFEETALPLAPPFTSILILIGLAGLILLIACFNFTTTTIALSGNRLREIGLRKAMGAQRTELVRQFLAESLVLCVPALGLGLLFGFLLATGLHEQGMSVQPAAPVIADARTWLFLTGIVVLTALIAGSYPAIYISAFKPVEIFAGRSRFKSTTTLTRFLLGVQLTASVLAIVVGLVFVQNARYQEEVPLGFNADEIITVNTFNPQVTDVFGRIAMAGPGVRSVGTSHGFTELGIFAYQALFSEAIQGSEEHEVFVIDTGPNYVETMELDMVSGRSFDQRRDDHESVILNQELVHQLGWDETSALGRTVVSDGWEGTVIGVVRDFKLFGMRRSVPPMSMHFVRPWRRQLLSVRADEGNLEQVREYLEDEWYKAFPDMPFYSGTLTETVIGPDRQTNDRISLSFAFLAVIATAISALGLFALVSLRIASRTKEIGIRKVLGASIASLLALINREAFYILVVAIAVGSAGGYYLCTMMLDEMFAFRLELGPLPAIVAGGIVLLVGLVTIGYRVFSASTANPVDVLRIE